MNQSNKLISSVTTFRTYSKYIGHLGRRETLEETINRNMTMHLERFPKLSKDIVKAYSRVHELKVMPSMRSMQFAGEAILKNNVRLFNCSFAPMDNTKVFSEALFLLLSGTGFGYSVQKRHVSKLPKIQRPRETGVYVIQDSIQGWADSLNVLMEAYFYGKMRPEFDFSNIRSKGSYLVTTGAKAPGPEPLKLMLRLVEEKLKAAIGRRLSSLEVHDIVCISSDAVLAGGIRRAALIALFDKDDKEMLTCKHGNWWEKAPYRARANNSVILHRQETTFEEFEQVFQACKDSNSGEPGISWTNDLDLGTNPCFTGEMLLKTKQGWRSFSELCDKEDLELFNYKGDVVKGKVWSNGLKDIINIKFSNNNYLRCTKDHRFMLIDGTECVAEDLKGLRVKPFIETNNDIDDEFVKFGFIQGDGSLTRLKSPIHRGLEVHIGDKDRDIATLFKIEYNEDTRSYYINGYNEILKDLQFSSEVLPKRTLPKTFNNWTNKQKRSFMRGLYSANGSIIKTNRISFKTTCKDLSLEISAFLLELGIENYITTNKPKEIKFNNGTYLCKESYDLNIGTYQGILKFSKYIGFVHQYKNDALENLINNKSPIVLSVTKEDGKEKVFDFKLDDDTHWGVVKREADEVGGFIAHNCHEISLNANQFCNLTTINQTNIKDKRDFMNRVYAATLIGTMQASYTDFYYLRPEWKEITDLEALLGVSFTGIADGNGIVTNEWLVEGAKFAKELNFKYAAKIGINPAARITTVKPEGTASCILGSSSGIHARHSEYYIRRIRMNKDDALAVYLKHIVPELVEDDVTSSNGVVVSIPQESPKNSIIRGNETAISLFSRTMDYNKYWVAPGHDYGKNKHNVSVTISLKDNEWDDIKLLMWNHRNEYSGISLLPYDGGSYTQAPFEECTKEKYEEMNTLVKEIDLRNVKEESDNTNRVEILACSGGNCEI